MEVSDEETSLNNTSIINTSTFREGDLELFLDCIEELCKKNVPTKKNKSKSKSRSSIKKQILNEQKQQQLNESINSNQHINARQKLNLSDVNEVNSSNTTNISFSTNNDTSYADTDMSYINEHFNDIFAYFDEDVITESSPLVNNEAYSVEKENIMSNFQDCEKLKESPQQKSYKIIPDRSKPTKIQIKEVQNKSKAILNLIKENEYYAKEIQCNQQHNFNQEDSERENLTKIKHYDNKNQFNCNIVNTNEKFNDEDIMNNGMLNVSVKEKISFFNNTTAMQRCNSVSPSIPSSSSSSISDEEMEIHRKSFQETRDYFEKIFEEKFRLQRTQTNASNESFAKRKNNNFIETNTEQNLNDYDRKIYAAKTYLQTQHLLERIQILVKAISKLDETRLSSMNLRLLKKFLVFIRDCSYKCQTVCFNITEEFLTDFKRNVMSAEELLISALPQSTLSQVFLINSKQYPLRLLQSFSAQFFHFFFNFLSIPLSLK